MPRQRLMAILASPVHPATSHLDRHNIHLRVVVPTPRLPIDIDSPNRWTLLIQNGQLLSVAEKRGLNAILLAMEFFLSPRLGSQK
jgi:hypothetical protein